MRYFIDFDRTIFDTPAFKKELSFRKRTLAVFFRHGRFIFLPDELRKFLYPEVEDFFAKHGHEITIVTYGVKMFITAKVAATLADFPVDAIVYTHKKKGHVLRKLIAKEEGPYAFIDDMVFQLESVSKRCPTVKVFEMRRDGRAGDGRWPVVHSLNDLPKFE